MQTTLSWRRWFGKQKHRLLALTTLAALAGYGGSSQAAEDPKCLSPNPADWPPPARPFFMIAFDTSASMVACTDPNNPSSGPLKQCVGAASNNSCGLQSTRINDGKCAVRKVVQAFGEVDFGLMSFPAANNCSGGAAACGPYNGANPVDGIGSERSGAGERCQLFTKPNAITCPAGAEPGGKLLVGLPVATDQVAQLVKFTDDSCESGDPQELMPVGGTPLSGLLQSAYSYIQGQTANLGPSCRPINVILITDGEESCNPAKSATQVAADMFNVGFDSGRKIRVYPIGFGGLSAAGQTALQNIADDGQCAAGDAACRGKVGALFANNEAELSIALSKIISDSIDPETCDNVDNNCNGCTDEGFKHYCNQGRVAGADCCSWNNQASRDNCVTAYQQTITANNPQGDLKKLPCWDPVADAAKLEPERSWLCINPGEICDDKDNNCEATTVVADLNQNVADEGFKKCGIPLACPAAEDSCAPGSQGVDDDCDGIIDNAKGSLVPYSACPIICIPSPEVCDGKDNDCDVPEQIDEGVPEIPCGPPAGPTTPPNCQGTLKCVNGSYTNKCDNNPQAEVCDGLDNDCNGQVDDGVDVPCEIPNTPGIKYQEDGFPNSQCKKGTKPCTAPASACGNYVGPSPETCDGIDNDCDGEIDEDPDGAGPLVLPGVGAPCGKDVGACKKGTRACVGGTFVCVGGVEPVAELCNGIDDDCDGNSDNQEVDFADAPAPDKSGCWSGIDLATCDPANVCQNPANGPNWCKPAEAGCADLGTLQVPCGPGKLTCQNTENGFAYVCKGGLVPSAEKCDGADNDCDGTIDEDLQVDPKPCSTACGQGTEVCKDGKITCSAPTPKPEECNNLDDNCDGQTDENVTEACSTECGSGTKVCKAGVFGPCSAPEKQAEVCDGLDNDCDGKIDENEDLDGTKDPLNPDAVIGAACGTDKGECSFGKWKCIGGKTQCVGGVTPQVEVCDGKDNDCDGNVDNETQASGPLCDKATGQVCVKTSDGNGQCAEKCAPGEFPCPAGLYTCQSVDVSGSNPPTKGDFCVQPSKCGDCATSTVKQTVGGKEQILCAPSSEPGAAPVPLCVCKDNQCRPPCAGVLCDAPLVCSDFLNPPGSCADNSCFTVPCGDGKACSEKGECVDNPCKPTSCKPDEACKPSSDLTKAVCTKSCAGVTCKTGEQCVDGACKASTCPKEGCGDGKVCDTSKAAAECVAAACKGCRTGQVCNPTTGKCEADPCDGMICPKGQRCSAGECGKAPEQNTGGAGGAGGKAGSGGNAGSSNAGTAGTGPVAGTGNAAGTSSTGAGGGFVPPIGLTTGGGGCTCSTGVGTPASAAGALSLLLAALPLVRRRQKNDRNRQGGAQ